MSTPTPLPVADAAFTRRQVVEVKRLVGPTFEPDWSEKAVIVGAHPAKAITNRADDEWYVVHFADGGGLSIHKSNMRASNVPAYKGRIPTYRQTQRDGCPRYQLALV